MSEKKASNFPLRLDENLKEEVRLYAGEKRQTQHAFIVEAIENHIRPKPLYDIKSVNDSDLISELKRRFNVAITIQMTEAQIVGMQKHHERRDEEGNLIDDGDDSALHD